VLVTTRFLIFVLIDTIAIYDIKSGGDNVWLQHILEHVRVVG
jgi:hypothetical protein